jgi:hypothetical protein
MKTRPAMPQAGPSLDPDGLLTYLGEDGGRRVVALVPRDVKPALIGL